MKCPSKVSDQKQIWRMVLPIALLALVLGTTLGEVWHHHANSLPDTCPICQLSHQAIEPPLASARVTFWFPRGLGQNLNTITSPRVPPPGTFPCADLPHNSLVGSVTCCSRHANLCTALYKKAERPCAYDLCVFQFC